MKHCSIWSCDRSPTVKIEWKDEQGRRCFAHFCDTHALEASERQARGKEPLTLEDSLEPKK